MKVIVLVIALFSFYSAVLQLFETVTPLFTYLLWSAVPSVRISPLTSNAPCIRTSKCAYSSPKEHSYELSNEYSMSVAALIRVIEFFCGPCVSRVRVVTISVGVAQRDDATMLCDQTNTAPQ